MLFRSSLLVAKDLSQGSGVSSAAPGGNPAAAPLLAKDLVPGDIVQVLMLWNHTMGSEQQKTRPWIVISSADFHAKGLGLFIGVPLTKQAHKVTGFLGARIPLSDGEVNYADAHLTPSLRLDRGLKRLALCEQVRTLSEKRLLGRAGSVDAKTLSGIRGGVTFVIDA